VLSRQHSLATAYLLPEDGQLPLFGDTWRGEVEPRASTPRRARASDVVHREDIGRWRHFGSVTSTRRGHSTALATSTRKGFRCLDIP